MLLREFEVICECNGFWYGNYACGNNLRLDKIGYGLDSFRDLRPVGIFLELHLHNVNPCCLAWVWGRRELRRPDLFNAIYRCQELLQGLCIGIVCRRSDY